MIFIKNEYTSNKNMYLHCNNMQCNISLLIIFLWIDVEIK